MEVLEKTEVGLQIAELKVTGQQIQFQVEGIYDCRERETQVTTREVILEHDSLTANLDSETFLGIIVTLPMDLVAWVATGPLNYLMAATISEEPEVSSEVTESRITEWLPEGTELDLFSSGKRTGVELRIDDRGWARLRLVDGVAASTMSEGKSSLEFAVARPETLSEKVTFRLGLDELMGAVASELPSDEARRRDAWHELRQRVPESATEIRAALWEVLEPLEQRHPYHREYQGLRIAEREVEGKRFSLQMQEEWRDLHRVGASERVKRVDLAAGTELTLSFNGRVLDFEPEVAAGGWVRLAMGEGYIERLLRAGTSSLEIELDRSEGDAINERVTLDLPWMIATADEEFQGTAVERLAHWRGIIDGLPRTPDADEVRSALLVHLVPIERSGEVEVAELEQLRSLNENLASAGGENPATTESLEECMNLQAQRADLLARQGEHAAAALALGSAARHASDLDDLDALEDFIQRQLASKEENR